MYYFVGKPNPPTFYGFYPDSISPNSVTIWWKPGFDGGLPQYFIISYNLTLSKWYNETAISHNNENRINKTITELASGSVYHVLIYAENGKGAVRVAHAIIFSTKGMYKCDIALISTINCAVNWLNGVKQFSAIGLYILKRSLFLVLSLHLASFSRK